jgi:biotin synthase
MGDDATGGDTRDGETPGPAALLAWLRDPDPAQGERLRRRADAARAAHVGDAVHLRALVELSNHCVRHCAYCGIRAPNRAVARYRLSAEQVLGAARAAADLGLGTVVLQAGEDPGLTAAWVAELVRRIKDQTGLAVTLGLGERSPAELRSWRRAGADRYLLRFETSNRALYDRLHPPAAGRPTDRLLLLHVLRELNYEVGSGAMVGLPGQTWDDLAADLELFRRLDLDMIGIGPFVVHPDTPLGRGEGPPAAGPDQVPPDEEVACRVVALARLVCPRANIPATTAVATLDRERGYERALSSGANVVMPCFTPAPHADEYQIYPGRPGRAVEPAQAVAEIRRRVAALGRSTGSGPGTSLNTARRFGGGKGR